MTNIELKNTIERMALGDEGAFRSIFNTYWERIFQVSKSICKMTEMAEEITQDVFLKVWLQREKFTGIENPEAYLFTIARNTLYSALRNKFTTIPLEDIIIELSGSKSFCPENKLVHKETSESVEVVIKKLPPQQKKVFDLSRNVGYSHAEIAEELNLSKQTVRAHMKQALRTLRSEIAMHAPILLVLLQLEK